MGMVAPFWKRGEVSWKGMGMPCSSVAVQVQAGNGGTSWRGGPGGRLRCQSSSRALRWPFPLERRGRECELHSMSQNESLEEQVATALETTPELLPFMPELLADLDELGTEVRDIIELLRPLGLPAGARVLDLGCGKGTVALALARELGLRVLGMDGFVPFVEQARRRAEEGGCRACASSVRGICAKRWPRWRAWTW
ncbi:methyltransferase domain-containing protein [Archangium gephyra]|nr:methyltransferase domain-containing protein [Archangium gephyra]